MWRADKSCLEVSRSKMPLKRAALPALLVWTAFWPGIEVTARGSGSGSSLVINGNLETADPEDPSRPLGWEKPDGLGVRWVKAPDETEDKLRGTGDVSGAFNMLRTDHVHHGEAIRMDTGISEKKMVARWQDKGMTQWNIPNATDSAIAMTYGLSYYSDAFAIMSGRTYRLSFDLKCSAGGGAKVWVRGYGTLKGKERRLYETVVHCRTKDGQWATFSQDFHPTRHTPDVTKIRIMLYAYYPPGVYWFDNVAVEPVTLVEDTP